MREYDLIADWYRRDRGNSVGVREALAAVSSLPHRARILDVGCGNGVPVTDALVTAGYRIVGLDSSSAIASTATGTTPSTPPHDAQIRQLFPDRPLALCCPLVLRGLRGAVWRDRLGLTRRGTTLCASNRDK